MRTSEIARAEPETGVPSRRSNADAIEQALIAGDLSRLSPEERLAYYKRVCESLGLNPLTKPFEYIRLNGQLRLYAKRDAADQLRKIHGISIEIVNQKREDDLYGGRDDSWSRALRRRRRWHSAARARAHRR